MRIILVFFFLLQNFAGYSLVKVNLFVFFKFDKYEIEPDYKNKIDSIIQKYHVRQVSIKAHCDSFGSNQYNDALSLKRANAVKQYLLLKNLSESMMDVQALGKRFPINQNENAEARALNRRAEIIFEADDYTLNKVDSIPKNIEAPKEVVAKSDTVKGDTSTLSLDNIEVGKTFVLENLNFYGGRHVLLPQSNKTLELLLNTLKTNPTLVIQIQGHICCLKSGDGQDFDTGTWNLSWTRAKAVYDYLVQHGINASRLSFRGFGASHKLVPEFTEEDRTTNRRVEIKVVKK